MIKKITAIIATAACVLLTGCLGEQDSSIAIIGGADGPTTIFVSLLSDTDLILTLVQVALFVLTLSYFIIKIKRGNK